MFRPHVFLIGCGLVLSALSAAQAGDWLRFRGPNGSGISSDEKPLPVTWSATENLQWKAPLPGPGSSSPIIVGDRVFVTCWSGYGTDSASLGDQKDLRLHLVCLDRKSGQTMWMKTVEPALPEEPYRGQFAEHGYASHTPVSDGQRVYVYFGKSGAAAFDLEGNELWRTPIGTGLHMWGSSSSPILYKNLVIITASIESQAVVALDKETGKEVWRETADGFGSTWGTPVLVQVDDERTDLVIAVPFEVWGLNPESGKLRWYCEALGVNYYCSSVVTDGDVIYGVEQNMGGGSIAVRAGGKGDVTQTHVVWSGRDNNRIGTPLIHEGRLYFVSGKVVNCVDAKTGERVYQERVAGGAAPAQPSGQPGQSGQPGGGRNRFGGGGGFGGGFGGGRGGQDYSSPIAADGKIYWVARSGEAYVLKLGDTFERLAVNRVTEDREDFSATPAVSDGQLFIRSSKHLYCIAASEK
jgi:outer membrane protein assembly factor BamB